MAASSSAADLHDALKKRGVTKMGVRLAVIAKLPEKTLACLEEHYAQQATAAAPAAAPAAASSTASFAAAEEEDVTDDGSFGRRIFVVMHTVVILRAQPDLNADQVGRKFRGDEIPVKGEQMAGWLKLADRDGWVLRDGRRVGLGELIVPMPRTAAAIWALPPLTVMANDGLCNRLRVVLSFAHMAQQRGRQLIVLWPVANVCNGRFTDAFEPLDNVTFVEAMPEGSRAAFCPGSHDFHPEVRRQGEAACTACYRLLQPTRNVRARVAANLAQLAPSFISLHIRRTDHWGSTATDDDYAAFVDRVDEATHAHAYLATDNSTTQARFLDSPKRGHRFKALKRITADPAKLRQTTLEDAAVDVFTAAAADGPFKGTYSSSFSDTILRLRRIGGTAHAADEHALTDAEFQMGVTLHTAGGHLQHSPGMPMPSTGRMEDYVTPAPPVVQ